MQAIRRIYEDSPGVIQIPTNLRGRKIEIIILPLDENEKAVDDLAELDDETRELVAAGLMRLPERNGLPDDFWEMDAPEVAPEVIAAAIRAERDDK